MDNNSRFENVHNNAKESSLSSGFSNQVNMSDGSFNQNYAQTKKADTASSHLPACEFSGNGEEISSNGVRTRRQTDAKTGNVTETMTNKDGSFLHSETDDKYGHKLSETEARKDATETTKYDGHGHEVSTTTQFPNGKVVETTDKDGNKIKQDYSNDFADGKKPYHTEIHDKSGRLVRDEFNDDKGQKTVKKFNKDGTETDSRYDAHGKQISEAHYDKNYHMTSYDEVAADGQRFREHFDAQGKKTATDWIDKNGKPFQHQDLDGQGRETHFVQYENGKPVRETTTKYDDKTGGKTETEKEGDTTTVKIYDKQGNFKEYDYDKDHNQKLYGEGTGKDGLRFDTDLPSDKQWQSRPYSDQ